MNKHTLFIALIALLASVFATPCTAQTAPKSGQSTVSIWIKNNSLFPHKVILKVREVGKPAVYGSYITVYLPYGSKKIELPVGATLEQMKDTDLPVMMNGKGNDITGKILVTAQATDQGKTFNLWD